MTVKSVTWYSDADPSGRFLARDIHLVRGFSSPRLDQLLAVNFTDGTYARADRPPPGSPFVMSFTPSYRLPAGRLYDQFNYGIKVDTLKGVVTVTGDVLPAMRPRSFIIIATAHVGADKAETRIRVHIHDHVVDKWLTPSMLHVRQKSRNMRFSVLGRFDDGVIGDITNWAPLDSLPDHDGDLTFAHPTDSNAPPHHWTGAGAAGMTVDPVNGEVRTTQPTGSVTVGLVDGSNQTVAQATAYAAPPWDTPVEVIPIQGYGVNLMQHPEVRNILFLPDGFVDVQRESFLSYVRALVLKMSTSSQTRPFDLVHDKLNYFAAWVASPQDGISALPEMFDMTGPDPTTNEIRGQDLELPVHPTAPAGSPDPVTGPPALTLEELIDLVGLPTPLGDPWGSPAGTNAGGRIHDWHELFDPSITEASVPSASWPDVYLQWNSRYSRMLINERDTAFHVSAGHRPRIDEDDRASVSLAFHPLRLTDVDFNSFLGALTAPSGAPLPQPNVWAEGGKDDTFIVMICRTGRHSGQNNGRGRQRPDGHFARYLCVPLGASYERGYVRLGGQVELRPDPIPGDIDPGPWAIMAHELSHSLTLLDEYAYVGNTTTADVEEIKTSSNVQDHASLHTNGVLTAANIKWRWKRLREAGVLASPGPNVDPVRPDPAGSGQFLITLRRGAGRLFVNPEADILRLRTRGPLRAPLYSERLRLIAVNRDELTVKPVTGAAVSFEPGIWVPGDLVVSPVRDKDPDYQNDSFGDDLELVHKSVLDRINSTANPLNAPWDAPHNRACVTPVPDNQPQNEYANFVGRPPRPRLLNRTVGLYEGGATRECGTYHPIGECMMRISYDKPQGGIAIMTPFCPVCRYILVDLIDPRGHGRIDRDYDREYPR